MSADRTSPLSYGGKDPMGLSRLPPLAPPRDVLPQILAEVRRRPLPARRGARLIGWVAAALLVLSVGAISLLASRPDRQSLELADWVRYSQQLESQLRAIGSQSRVMRGHRAVAMGQLEDRIAMIDWRLSERPGESEEIALWRQRAAVLNDLVTVQAGELVFSEEQDQRPVVTINPPLARPVSYETMTEI